MTDVHRTVVRARDLLVAHLRFHGLELDPSGTTLTPSGSGDPLIAVELPPQHAVEQTFDLEEPASDDIPAARSRLAAWSRVVFRVPASVTSVPLQLAPLLALLEDCELAVVDAALPRSADPQPPGCLSFGLFAPSGPKLRAPAAEETAVELPFRLIVSPPGAAGFLHHTRPFTTEGRTELWHSQLGVAPHTLGELDASDRSVRAVWLRTGDSEQTWDPEHPVPAQPIPPDTRFQWPLDHERRHEIVHLSANFNARPSVALDPRAISVRRLALTSLGATVDLRGEWTPPGGMSIEEWVHRAAVGRDHFVRVVTAGWLLPFGHRASRVDIFERRFAGARDEEGRPRWRARPALEWRRTFVVVREPVREYTPATAPSDRIGRAMPLRWVRVRTLITPELAAPAGNAFSITLADGTPFAFDVQGGDRSVDAQNLAEFRSSMWFVAQNAGPNDISAAITAFGQQPAELAGTAGDGRGVPLDVVAADKQPGDDATWRVHTITWAAVAGTARGSTVAHPAPFHPQAASIGLRMPAVEVVTGSQAATTITFHERFLEHGLDAGQNPGAVVASLPTLPLGFQGKGDRAGGLVRPELGVSGLSVRVGPVAGPKLDDVASGAFNPSDFFAGAAPKLFGILELDRLLKATGLLDGTGTPRAPKLLTDPLGAARFQWEPQLRDYPDSPGPIFLATPDSRLTVLVDAHAPAAPEISCTLEHFRLRLVPGFEAIELHFAKAAFAVRSGKPDVEIELAEPVKFIGALSFVETLTKFIPVDAFSDPPSLDVTPSGAELGLRLALPSLTLGMFSLENVSFGAGVLVPFDERALAVRFEFCRRHEPFLLTVSALGGGGFFSMELDARGLQRLEAALEFGASLSMNFGVASGGVHIMAGIYLAYESEKGVALTGYLRAGGNVSVLGLISVSIELYLSLTYEPASGKAVGRATLTVEIDIFLFSTSVEISCERKFAGSASDPSFEQVMSRYRPDEPGVGDGELEVRAGAWPWAQYCEAYG
jgi:hypothetical protein